MYKVFFKKSAVKELAHLPTSIIMRIKLVTQKIAIDPFLQGTKSLKGYKNLYRIRTGDYRIVYLVERQIKIVTITKIAHRKEVYSRLT